MNKPPLNSIARYLLLSLPLALPIAGIMYYDEKILAVSELLDPIELYKSNPLCMKMVHWALVVALISAFTPFKRISSLAAGIALGSFAFYGIDQYSIVKDMSEMGLSEKPLMDLVEITKHGKWLVTMCILCALTQIIYAIAAPLMSLKKAACNNTDGLKVDGSD